MNSFINNTPTAPEIVNHGATFCEIAKPWCPKDTDDLWTRYQAHVHNEKGKALGCPNWKPQYCVAMPATR